MKKMKLQIRHTKGRGGARPNYKLSIRNTIYKTTDENRGWKKLYHENINHKKAGVDKQ